MRRRGFSLSELSFVITIMLILSGLIAGGGSYMMKRAAAQEAVENAKAIFTGMEHYMTRRNGSIGRMFALSTNLGSQVTYNLRPYLKGSDPFVARQFRNPYTGTNEYPLASQNTGTGSYPTSSLDTTDTFVPASYPSTVKNHAGRVLYFCKNDYSAITSLAVFDGETTRTFQYFAVQVVDQNGQPLITIGR